MKAATKLQKGIQYWKRNGTKAFLHRLTHPHGIKPIPYDKWFEAHKVSEEELQRQRETVFSFAPEICILSTGTGDLPEETPLEVSVRGQTYPKGVLQKEGASQGSEKGSAGETSADYFLFCDAKGTLEPDALFAMVEALNKDRRIDALYADEGFLLPNGKRTAPCFKPDYSPEYLTCINYIGRPFLISREVLAAAGGLPEAWNETAYWNLVLRCCEKAQQVGHIARVLLHTPYATDAQPHERKSALGTKIVSGGAIPSEAVTMVEQRLRSVFFETDVPGSIPGEEEPKVHVEDPVSLQKVEIAVSGNCLRPIFVPKTAPKVSILIPNKDEAETLRTCLTSILTKSTYGNYEIIVIENNSEEEKTFAYYKELEAEDRVHVITFPGDFNYSRINNFGAEKATGEVLVLLNNDTEVITPDWLERMLGYALQEEIGIVGAKLLYPDGSLQHGGVVIGIGGGASHVFSREARQEDGTLCRLQAITDVSAVTAACMMISKKLYAAVGGLDESFAVNFNDVTLCLQVREMGYRIVMHGGVELFHYESKSRGLDTSDEKYKRFMDEVYRFRQKWKRLLEMGDPYYNPNLSLMFVDCRPRYEKEHFAFIEQIEREREYAGIEHPL